MVSWDYLEIWIVHRNVYHKPDNIFAARILTISSSLAMATATHHFLYIYNKENLQLLFLLHILFSCFISQL
jgi:hypothetical protein